MNNKLKLKLNLIKDILTLSFNKMFNDNYIDSVTGCLNRKAFEHVKYSKIAIVDMDSLKFINDTLGHEEGDKFLKALSKSLIKTFGEDNVYRLGGDEFGVVSNESLENSEFHCKLIISCELNKTYSFGIAETLKEADLDLNNCKEIREYLGLRSSRGECPPWMRIKESNVIDFQSALLKNSYNV